MKRAVLAVLIDAFGYDLLDHHPFMQELNDRRPLATVAGFSSSAIPSLLTGKWPNEHGRWFLYGKAGNETPFTSARLYAWAENLPKIGIRARQRYERKFAQNSGINEYYHLYNIPLKYLPSFDLPGKRSIYEPGAIDGVPNLFDKLVEHGIPYASWNWSTPEERNFAELHGAIREAKLPFYFFYSAVLDGVMHATGTGSQETRAVIESNQKSIREAVRIAEENYDEVSLYIFSDHGMVNVENVIDLMGDVRALPFVEGKDYLPFYDSTYARFWFQSERAETAIRALLESASGGRLLSREELERLHVWFPDREYGDAIFLTDAGTVIAPSFMGNEPPCAMHGYHPEDAGSNGMLIGSRAIPSSVTSIRDMALFLEQEARRAHGTET